MYCSFYTVFIKEFSEIYEYMGCSIQNKENRLWLIHYSFVDLKETKTTEIQNILPQKLNNLGKNFIVHSNLDLHGSALTFSYLF